MADTVTLPGFGKPVPKAAVAVGLAVVGVLIFEYYKNKNASSSGQASATGTDPFPPDGTVGNPSDPYSTDPVTGRTYGDEGQYSGSGGYGTGGGSNNGGGGSTGGPPFSTNAAWSQWVIQQMSANDPQLNVAALSDALGLYLAGQPVNASQKQLIFEARAIGGDPPVAGPNNYPPNIHGGGQGGGGNVTVPGVVGQRLIDAEAAITKVGLKYSAPPFQQGVQLNVTSQSPAAGHRVAEGSTVTLQAAPAVIWRLVKAPGNLTLAQMAHDSDPAVSWSQVIAHNGWAVKYAGKPIPKGYGVLLPYAS